MKISAALLLTATFLAGNAQAAETEITVYNQNLALIKKNQTLNLNQGINEIVFDEVAQQLQPESAFIYGNGVRVLEQNYDYAGINYATMLNAVVGKKVKTVRQNPATGENIFEEAELIAADGQFPVLKFDYGIETNFPGRVLFENVPQELNSTPVLMAKIEAASSGKTDLGLAYLATGFSWDANYVARVNDDKTLSLLGRASISNNSGSGYDGATVNLIAGDVNKVYEQMQPRMFKGVRANLMYATANGMDSFEEKAVIDAPSNLDGYYVYKVPGKTTLKNGQIKQVSFISAPEVKYEKEGVITSSLYFGADKNPPYKDVHPDVFYRFTNDKSEGLGMPLVRGKVSFYAPDDNGALQFIGENVIDHKAEGQKVSLQIGKSFDVYGHGVTTEIRKVDEVKYKKNPKQDCPTTATTYRYNVTYTTVNKGKNVAHIILKQALPFKAKIITESYKGQSGDGNVYEWHFSISAGQEFKINAEVENVIEKYGCD